MCTSKKRKLSYFLFHLSISRESMNRKRIMLFFKHYEEVFFPETINKYRRYLSGMRYKNYRVESVFEHSIVEFQIIPFKKSNVTCYSWQINKSNWFFEKKLNCYFLHGSFDINYRCKIVQFHPLRSLWCIKSTTYFSTSITFYYSSTVYAFITWPFFFLLLYPSAKLLSQRGNNNKC